MQTCPLSWRGVSKDVGRLIRAFYQSNKVYNRTMDKIPGLKTLSTVTELRSFVGLFNFFRIFFPSSERISSLLNNNLKSNQPIIFGELDDLETNTFYIIEEKQ